MKTQLQGAPAPIPSNTIPSGTARVEFQMRPFSRLAPNVIALHANERPPVVQTRRRGRLPAGVSRLFRSARPKFYVGVVCLLREASNHDVPVRVFQVMEDGRFGVCALTDRLITIAEAGVVTDRALVKECVLIRTATLRGLYA